jgi:hypothetical protein
MDSSTQLQILIYSDVPSVAAERLSLVKTQLRPIQPGLGLLIKNAKMVNTQCLFIGAHFLAPPMIALKQIIKGGGLQNMRS